MPASPCLDIVLADLVNGDSLWPDIVSQLRQPHTALWLHTLESPLGQSLCHQNSERTPNTPVTVNNN
jgi:hypothetical protein